MRKHPREERPIMPKPFNRLRPGGRAAIAAALVSLALAGAAVGAPAASASPLNLPVWSCDWQHLDLTNGWQSEQGAYGTGNPAWCGTGEGMVYLSGSLAQPTAGPNEFAVLPPPARPPHNLYLSVYTYDGAAGVLQIKTDGEMFAYNAPNQGDARDFTSLAGVSFPLTGAASVYTQPLTLLNGWQSAQSQWGTGDPSYSLINGIVHLSGSLNGSHVPSGLGDQAKEFAVLPQEARPDYCSPLETYDYAGNPGTVEVDSQGVMRSYVEGGSVYQSAASAFTSLAGLAYPVNSWTSWQPLNLINGWSHAPGKCATGIDGYPSYYIKENVVYLTGTLGQATPNGNGVIAVLPPAAPPYDTLYLNLSTEGNTHASLRISPDGTMYLWGADAAGLTSLAGISYEYTS
jgi:hypothetical protein